MTAHGERETGRKTPVGIIIVSLVFVLYAFFWALTSLLAGVAGNAAVATGAAVVTGCVLALAYLLYRGSRPAWVVALLFLGVSTLWRFARAAGGESGDLTNAVVGVALVTYLFARRGFYRPS